MTRTHDAVGDGTDAINATVAAGIADAGNPRTNGARVTVMRKAAMDAGNAERAAKDAHVATASEVVTESVPMVVAVLKARMPHPSGSKRNSRTEISVRARMVRTRISPKP